jgi:hypothetical protein
MFRKSPVGLAIAALIGAPLCAHAELDISAELKNETAVFIRSGQMTGQARTTKDDRENDAGDLMKFENSARIFVNGDVGEESTWHAELRPVWDTEGIDSDYKGHENYTQNDYLRELYVDTNSFGWDFRAGKQQVVWGTADGIKLLDIINPTDFRELNQNAVEDARIPVWMINAESYIGERGNIQLILSQAETNKVPGLWTQNDGSDRSTTRHDPTTNSFTFTNNGQIEGQDRDHPFILKGVDVITGGVNGFFNIGSAFAGVTNTFSQGGFLSPGGSGTPAPGNPFAEFTTVDGFVNAPALPAACGPAPNGAACLEAFTELTNANVTNLIDVNPSTGAGWNVSNPNSAWEHFPNATFATFNAYVGMKTEYRRDYDDDLIPEDANLGGRFRSYLDNGLNYSVNYFYGYDANPHVNIHWEDPKSGRRLKVQSYDSGVTTPSGRAIRSLQIVDPKTGNNYGGNASGFVTGLDNVAPGEGGPAKLVFVEDRNRIHNLGTSFDYATEAADIPLVLRGEFLYQKDVMQPVVDRGELADGNLVGGLKSEEADFFKYVIGLDATVMTNLLVSGQFIQFRNLDYVDDDCKFTTQGGARAECSRYTGDAAVMNVENGLQQGKENKEFYSLFLSKPFGPNQLGRWNNIIIYEEGGGYWDRLDAEYTVTDQLIVGGELNFYWGDDDTLFGQFDRSSNAQITVKYIIE